MTSDRAEGLASRVVARSGQGYALFRIPTLQLSASGALIAVFDARRDLDDLPAPIDLVMR